jgi:stress response protein YsnF
VVIEKRLVVRERVIVRKRRVVEEHLVAADVRRERLEVEADESVADRLDNGAQRTD